ncbi:hypothetical protein RHMOL_Rhmol11G0017300 [Rhododendron molle]|uniref:Uncharacterized protein n=1 Tax=Rhododendron molle TaxID=49168 RepID=A0ACC0LMG6_RHOML|nr:hypothetical protein RHMOL_Rhmol11G0017300 [Rhododendron molle]
MEPAIEDQTTAVEAAQCWWEFRWWQQQWSRGIGSPPRDPARGKRAVVAEEETIEISYQEEYVLFWPVTMAATSSSHKPITKYDVAEHLPDEALAKLLEDDPIIGEIVRKAKEYRAWAIVATEAAERAKRR